MHCTATLALPPRSPVRWLGCAVLVALSAPAVASTPSRPSVPSVSASRPLPRFFQSNPDGSFPAILQARAGEDLAALERLAVIPRRRDDGTPSRLGDQIPCDGSLEAIRRARAAGFAIEVARTLRPIPPTRVTSEQVQARALWATGPAPTGVNLGAGRAILDIDSGIDPYHPHFFRADAGQFDWFDVRGDGALDPGTDGIDGDGDGRITPREVLHLVDTWDLYYDASGEVYDNVDGHFDPARDYLYLDRDRDGVRSFGSAAGFGEDDPGFGEPIFVPDDADRDGAIDGLERVVQLGTSVIAGIEAEGTWYKRGRDLLDYPVVFDLAYHGSGVGGILVGGQLPWQRAYAGLAPEADLWVVSTSGSWADMIAGMDHALRKGATVVLHEYAPWANVALDGTEAMDQAVDASMAGGVVHVCPTGNLADAGKHTVAAVAGGRVEVRFTIPSQSPFGYDYQWAAVDLHGPAGAALPSACEARSPSGEVIPLQPTASTEPFSAGWSWADRWITARDHPIFMMTLWTDAGPLEAGTWSLACDHPVDGTAFHGFLDDYISGWSRGMTFEDEVRANTMGMPSTSDRCVAVGAHAGRWPDADVAVGELRTWSSRGPTVDGRRTVDLTAPDDPFAPYVSASGLPGWEAPYWAFGGTSGASPHVAAVALLLQASRPEWTGDDVREALIAAAAPMPGVATTPDDGSGHGRVQGYAALFGVAPDAPPEPVAVSAWLKGVGTPEACRWTVVGEADGVPGAEFRVDVGYDGTWEADFGEVVDITDALDGPTPVRVEAAHGGWPIGGVATVLDPGAAPCEDLVVVCGCATAGPGWTAAWLPLLVALRRRASGRRDPRDP